MELLQKLSLVQKIIIGLLVGVMLGLLVPGLGFITILGDLFIKSLQSIAPLLVFFLIMASLANHKQGEKTYMKSVIVLYAAATLVAALTAVVASYLFPITIALPETATATYEAPESLTVIIQGIILNTVTNPVTALMEGEFLAILLWSVLAGIALQHSSETTKAVISDISGVISCIIEWVIQLAPLGIIGLVYRTLQDVGLQGLVAYGRLIALLVAVMLVVMFIIYPIMVWALLRQNPFPLTWYCVKGSGLPAFFTRSSAVNIPINMDLAEKLQLKKESYAISIPLGASANSGGAAITISIMTLAAAHTLGITPSFILSFLLCVLSALSATGVSGIAGGSLLLIPLAASLFNISSDVAMQMVGVGFIIGVIQDSVETAVNSASDLLFTAAAEFYEEKKRGNIIDINQRVKEAERR